MTEALFGGLPGLELYSGRELLWLETPVIEVVFYPDRSLTTTVASSTSAGRDVSSFLILRVSSEIVLGQIKSSFPAESMTLRPVPGSDLDTKRSRRKRGNARMELDD